MTMTSTPSMMVMRNQSFAFCRIRSNAAALPVSADLKEKDAKREKDFDSHKCVV